MAIFDTVTLHKSFQEMHQNCSYCNTQMS